MHVVVISFIFQFLIVGSFSASSVFLVALLNEFGWSHTLASTAFAIGSLVSVIGQPIVGRVIDLVGTRKVMTVGAIMTSIGYLLNGQVLNIWQFWITNGFFVTSGSLGGSGIPNTILLSNWFVHNRGRALGLAAAGGGIGMLVFPPMSGVLISHYGWRIAYVLIALPMVLIALPLAVFVLDDKRPEHDRRNDEARSIEVTAKRKKAVAPLALDWNLPEASLGTNLNTSCFLYLSLAFFFEGVARQALFLFQTTAIVHAGYNFLLVTSIVGMVGGITAVSQAVGGWFSDRMGVRQAYTVGSVALVLGILALLMTLRFPAGFALLLAYTLFTGFGIGAHITTNSIAIPAVFSGPSLGLIVGLVFSAHSLGSSLGSLLGGWMFDQTGNYESTFLLSLGLIPIATYCFWQIRPLGTAVRKRIA